MKNQTVGISTGFVSKRESSPESIKGKILFILEEKKKNLRERFNFISKDRD